MGLDNFWEMPTGKKDPVFRPKLKLCGGIYSNNGQGSFRGKAYATIIEEITGVSLYQEKIDSETIKKMAEDLAVAVYGSEFVDWSCTEQEFSDLQRMFKKYAMAGASLEGWW